MVVIEEIVVLFFFVFFVFFCFFFLLLRNTALGYDERQDLWPGFYAELSINMARNGRYR